MFYSNTSGTRHFHANSTEIFFSEGSIPRMDNIKTWTGLSVEESIRMTEERDKRRKYVRGVAKLSDRRRLKNRTEQNIIP